jgi:hypothetical protein
MIENLCPLRSAGKFLDGYGSGSIRSSSVILHFVRWPILLVLCGCQSLLGLDEPGTYAAPDASRDHGRIYMIAASNSAAFEPVESELALPGASGDLVENGTRTPLVFDSAGYVTIPATQHPYRLVLDLGQRYEVVTAGSSVDLARLRFAHPDAQVATSGTQLKFDIMGAAASGYNGVYTTGVWSSTLAAAANPTITVDFTVVGFLLDAAAHDRAYGVHLSQFADYFRLDGVCAADVTMINGVTTQAFCDVTTMLAADRCVHLRPAMAAEEARVTSAIPPTEPFSNGVTAWSLLALARNNALLPGLPLAFSNTKTEDVTLPYIQPFPGYTPMAVMSVARSRTVAIGGRSVPLSIVTTHEYAAAADCAAAQVLTAFVAFPGGISIDNRALSSDNTLLAIDRAQPAVVRWDINPVPGSADYHTVALYDIEAGTWATTIFTTYDTAAIDPDLLKTGHHYFVRVQAVAGAPYAANGDFTTTSYPTQPRGIALRDSPIFIAQ